MDDSTITVIRNEACSQEMKKELGETHVRILIGQFNPGYQFTGFVFTYTSEHQGHGWYAGPDGNPFTTADAALQAAQDPQAEIEEWYN